MPLPGLVTEIKFRNENYRVVDNSCQKSAHVIVFFCGVTELETGVRVFNSISSNNTGCTCRSSGIFFLLLKFQKLLSAFVTL